MTIATKPMVVATIAAFLGVISIALPADARRVIGVRAYPHAYAYRPGRWVNGVWLVNGVAASVAVGTASNCPYYGRRLRETGRTYWRERYNEMCN